MRQESHVEVERRNRAGFLAADAARRAELLAAGATHRAVRLFEDEVALFGGRVTRRALLLAVAIEFNASVADLVSARRDGGLCRVRFAFCRLARLRLRSSFPQIGRAIGDRDHTTALHALRRGQALMLTDPDFAARSARVEARLWPAQSTTSVS